MGFNTFTPDYENYEMMYETSFARLVANGESDYEIGFVGLCGLGNLFGWSFQQFRIFYAAIIAVLTLFAAKRLSRFPNILLAFYLLWPFVPNVSGIRQCLANTLVVCGIPCLFKNERISDIKFLVWVLFAYLIHQSSAFFALLLFFPRAGRMVNMRMIVVLLIVLFFIIGSTNVIGRIPFISANPKLNKWLNMNSGAEVDNLSFTGVLLKSSFVFAYYWLVTKMCRSLKCGLPPHSTNGIRISVCNNTAILILLTIPLYMISGEFQRLLYAMLMVFYSIFAEYYLHVQSRCNSNKKVLAFSFCLLVVITCLYYMVTMTSHDVLATFKDNSLLG